MATTGTTGRTPRNLEIAELDKKDRYVLFLVSSSQSHLQPHQVSTSNTPPLHIICPVHAKNPSNIPLLHHRADTAKALRRLTTLVTKHAKEGKELLEMVSYLGPRATAKPGEIRKEVCSSSLHPSNPFSHSQTSNTPPRSTQTAPSTHKPIALSPTSQPKSSTE